MTSVSRLFKREIKKCSLIFLSILYLPQFLLLPTRVVSSSDFLPFSLNPGNDDDARDPSVTKYFDKAFDFVPDGIDALITGSRVMEIPEKSANVPPDSRFDFVVVGAGTAGATIASRLSEIKGVSVLLIEAGGDEKLFMDVPALVNLLQFSKDLNWQYKTEPSNEYCLGMEAHRCKWPRGRVIGGSSVLNSLMAVRGNKRDYDRWSRLGNDGWSWEEVLPYFRKLEAMGIAEFRNDTKHHNVGGPVSINYVPFRSPIAKAFVKAGKELGWDEVDYNGERQTGFSFIQTNTKDGMRLSSNRAYLRPNEKRKNLSITKRSLVRKIIIDEESKRALGVEFVKEGETIRVWAKKEVILSAGAIGSPQILMLSGIGPREHLESFGIRVLRDSPVGENLQDHIAYGGLVFLLDQPVGISGKDLFNPLKPPLWQFLLRREGPLASPGAVEGIAFVNVDDPSDPGDYPNMELLFVSNSVATAPLFRENVGLDEGFWRKTFANVTAEYSWTIFPMLLRPKSRGKILLSDTDVRKHPRIIPNYMKDPEDVRILIKGVRLALKLGKTYSMQRFGSELHATPVSGCEFFEYDSDDYWECAIRHFTMNIYHYSGTCKMGAQRDPTAVVNPRLQVIGIQGLRVADASIMPEIPSGHTNIPTFMIAEKLADMVKQDWGYLTDPLP
ncbi:glucose dehydrogenase [FAD, quinone]-like [Venturia canescens]|uniref:glucose dehydrogenase [FAD, quinone]-like n=1 Tax=Venturia canescens TaxID=32260 RepID=UPI001C9D1C79|nr:glucose dehydrogenase [FAD, quinone]-like [Venturia canescens]